MKLVIVKLLLQKVNEFGFSPSDINFNQMKSLSLENPYGYLKFFVISLGGGGGCNLQKVKPYIKQKHRKFHPNYLSKSSVQWGSGYMERQGMKLSWRGKTCHPKLLMKTKQWRCKNDCTTGFISDHWLFLHKIILAQTHTNSPSTKPFPEINGMN